jgi:hypothetical protein
MHHPSVEADPVPRFCPRCGWDAEDEPPEPALTTPHIALSIKSTVDTMHREMEAGAEFRANIAMDKFGLDAAEASAMKLGDMKDNLRMGDTSDVPVNNPVSQVMSAAPQGMFGFQGAAGLGYSGAVTEGPFPNAGARAQSEVRRAHAEFTRAAGHVGATTSSMPALETLAPGYRQRVR